MATRNDANWSALPLSDDLTALAFEAVAQNDCARATTLKEVAHLLASPDTGAALKIETGALIAATTGEFFPLRGERPLVLPKYARGSVLGDTFDLPPESAAMGGRQYLLLSSIKMRGGPQNSDYHDIWFQRHVHRSRKLLKDATGVVLDVGCDRPSISRKLFPPTARFLGLEPSLGAGSEFCLCGMAEHIPLKDESVDAVSFMTSLDHILDYQLAVDEARRVLKPGGCLYLASLVWTDRASLVGDTVHFHHFRDFELQGALRGLHIESIERYVWKSDTHRYGIYLAARKPA